MKTKISVIIAALCLTVFAVAVYGQDLIKLKQSLPDDFGTYGWPASSALMFITMVVGGPRLFRAWRGYGTAVDPQVLKNQERIEKTLNNFIKEIRKTDNAQWAAIGTMGERVARLEG